MSSPQEEPKQPHAEWKPRFAKNTWVYRRDQYEDSVNKTPREGPRLWKITSGLYEEGLHGGVYNIDPESATVCDIEVIPDEEKGEKIMEVERGGGIVDKVLVDKDGKMICFAVNKGVLEGNLIDFDRAEKPWLEKKKENAS